MIRLASRSWRVTWMSAALGDGSSEGWLWTTITDATDGSPPFPDCGVASPVLQTIGRACRYFPG